MSPGMEPVGPASRLPEAARAPGTAAPGFGAALAAAQLAQTGGELRLSAHAAQRLRQAGIGTEGPGWAAVRQAVQQVAEKGSRQTLVIWPPCSLVVAVPQRVVVTALTAERLRPGAQVVTGIDSAVFVPGT